MEKRILTSEIQTRELAQELLDNYLDCLKEKALLFALEGDLGAGKTTFTKGVGDFLNVGRPIRSPGYVLVTEYPYKYEKLEGKILHVDLWRVQDASEAQSLGIKEFLKPANIIIIEWAHKIPEFISQLCTSPKKVKAVRVHFDYKSESEREVEVYELC